MRIHYLLEIYVYRQKKRYEQNELTPSLYTSVTVLLTAEKLVNL